MNEKQKISESFDMIANGIETLIESLSGIRCELIEAIDKINAQKNDINELLDMEVGVNEAAKLMNCCKLSVYNRANKGEIISTKKDGKTMTFSLASIREYNRLHSPKY